MAGTGVKLVPLFCTKTDVMRSEKAILAGGCFWGMEELIRDLPGVKTTIVGYTGGDVKTATYRNHGTHA
ncbi:MAG TPA: peptide-methionine (S)-S-oxide reductase, partial [Flavisolibacter sp.]|nr:peptide-methionine (S)-S-oxide reductase [Flavisolibacter sp.]